MFEKTLIDMREHGTQTLGQALHVAIKSRDREFGPDDIKATREQNQAVMRLIKKVFGRVTYPVTFGVGHQIAYYWDRKKNWFAF